MENRNITISEFLNTSMLDYSVYKLIQQIPFILDGLAQTQRKIVWTLLNKPKKKFKSLDSFNLIYDYTNYLHGDASAINVWNNLAAEYKNNLNLLTPKGTFGYRISQQAAAPRYTSAILSDLSEKIFPKIDKDIRQAQFLEGKEIEPIQLYPIIPIGLINGTSGIAVGYSANILPRDPVYITKLLINILENKVNKIPKILPIKLPYFKGKIYNGDNDKQFIIEGILKKGKSTKRFGTIIMEEIPWGYDREKMVKILNDLEDAGKVADFKDNCAKNTFYFEVKVPIEIYNLSEDKLIDLFKLKIKQSEVLTFIKATDLKINWSQDDQGVYTDQKTMAQIKREIKTYNNAAEYLYDWIIERLKMYKKRKFFILGKIEYDINVLKEKARFIKGVIDNEIIFMKKKKKDIESQLEKLDFMKIDDKYDYLLGMNLWSLTQEKIPEINKKIRELTRELNTLKKTPEKQLWINELKEILPYINTESDKK